MKCPTKADAVEGATVVLSPHLDDAVLSIGATIAQWARHGRSMVVATVLSGHTGLSAPAGRYDRACGFATAGDAVRARQREDSNACRTVGAHPLWLPYWDGYYGKGAEASSSTTIAERIKGIIDSANLTLIPGFPLAHPDHAWLTRLVLGTADPDARIGFYVEQPYTMSRHFGSSMRVASPWCGVVKGLDTRFGSGVQLGPPTSPAIGGVDWQRTTPSPLDWIAKYRAISAYQSQLRKLGRLMRLRLAAWELLWGGEFLSLPSFSRDSEPSARSEPKLRAPVG